MTHSTTIAEMMNLGVLMNPGIDAPPPPICYRKSLLGSDYIVNAALATRRVGERLRSFSP